jgi:tRNA threonylcarbamoyladenosine biosynthesis protein TsaB
VIVLGFDTATSATAVGLRLADGTTLHARDDPGPGEHPGHATRLLALAARLLGEADLEWSALQRIAVGVGPGRFTGLRVGIATARGLAQSLAVELVGVSSPRALAEPAGKESEAPVLAVIDARRGEVFVAAYIAGEELISPRAAAPEELEHILAQIAEREGSRCAQTEGHGGRAGHEGRWWALGDGAVRYRDCLRAAGATVPEDSSSLHLISGEAICEIAVSRAGEAIAAVLPDYRRRPDAEIALERTVASGSTAA